MRKDSITIQMDKASVNLVIKNMNSVRSGVVLGGLAGVDAIADRVYDKAGNTCPTSSGTLKSTLYKESEVSGDVISVNIGHGGKYDKVNPATGESADSYAVEVHESFKISPENRAKGATWKWLEKAFNSELTTAEKELANSIRAALGG